MSENKNLIEGATGSWDIVLGLEVWGRAKQSGEPG